MTDLAVRLPVAGWYKDPANAERLRWWTGETWSQHTIERPTKKDDVEASDERPRSRGAHRAAGEPDVAAAAREAAGTEGVTTGEIAAFIAAETGQTPALAAAPVIVEPAGSELVAAVEARDDVDLDEDLESIDDLDLQPRPAVEQARDVTTTTPEPGVEIRPADAGDPSETAPAAEIPVAEASSIELAVEPEPAPRPVSLVPEVMETSVNSPLLEQLAAAPPPVVAGSTPGTDVVVAASGVSFDELMKQLPFAVDPATPEADALPGKAGRSGKGAKARKTAKQGKAVAPASAKKAAGTSDQAAPAGAAKSGPRTESVQTVGAWLLALLPIVAAVLATAALVLPLVVPAVADFALLGAGALTLLLGVVFAAADDAALAKRGVEKRVTAVIGLLTPLPYLALRTLSLARQKRNGVAPLAVFVVLLGAAAAGYLLAGDRLPELVTLVQDQARALLGL
ncbi:hypothetical protein GCM10027515_24660 [Schumannella luteola]|uniref:DUF2510 domain-containing protein n=1 Tax=Schumannella luteola TaxID=472059 RepID=A0A852Y9U6_9MICO|nr:hypothetical protein [Schumannella luteola]